MFRGLLKLVLVVVVLVAAGAFLLGWWGGGGTFRTDGIEVIGTAGVDHDKARAAGAEVGEKTAQVADKTAAAVAVAEIRPPTPPTSRRKKPPRPRSGRGRRSAKAA